MEMSVLSPKTNIVQFHTIVNISDHIDLVSFTLIRQEMIMITDLMGFFLEVFPNQSLFQTYPKCISRHTWITQLKKKYYEEKKPKAITVLKKEGVEGVRRDMIMITDSMGFFYAFPY